MQMSLCKQNGGGHCSGTMVYLSYLVSVGKTVEAVYLNKSGQNVKIFVCTV